MKVRKESQIHKLYNKYEFLCSIYAKKLFDMESLSMDREDVMQEFRTKLFEVIVKYVKQFSNYRKGERSRPIQIEPYLRFSMSNLVNDFIKKSNTKKHGGWSEYLSIERDSFDFSGGQHSIRDHSILANFKISEFNEDSSYEVNGVDLLDGLKSREHKLAVLMYLKGHKIKIIDKILKFKSGEVIKSQLEKLKRSRELLLESENSFIAVYDSVED